MRTKRYVTSLSVASIFLVFLCMYMSSIVPGRAALIILPIGSSLLLALAGDDSFSFLPAVLLLALLLAVLIRRRFNPGLCFESRVITHLEGRVVFDSSFTGKGNHLMRISLSRCSTINGDRGWATGLVTVLGDTRAMISYGVKVSLEGRFSDGIFIYDNLQVLSRNAINDIREGLVSNLQVRLLGSASDDASLLSSLLLLGRAESSSLAIKDKALSCGCAHVLALSGMHLGILAGLCRRLFGGKRLSAVLAGMAVTAFVFVAGPRPSLVRAVLAFYLSFLPSRERVIAVLLLQMILFPETMVELGCCYGYAAVFSMVFLSPYVEAALFQMGGNLASVFCSSVCVPVLCIPIQMASNGFWCPGVILASPIAGLLAGASMLMGLLLLIFGRTAFLLKANSLIFRAMDGLFDLFGSFPKAGWLGYAVLLASMILVFVLVLVLRIALRRRALAGSGVIDLLSSADLNFGL